MKVKLLISLLCLTLCYTGFAQVTQINSNKSLQPIYTFSSTKTLLYSDLDSSLWVTDGTLNGTIQLSTSIFYDDAAGVLNGKLVFSGHSAANGNEIFSTDGTAAGTVLVKDINTGTADSDPGYEFAQMNGVLYFSASRPAEGRELWRTDGTNAGTTLVKDIVPGADSSNAANSYNFFTAGSYILFAAKTAGGGIELWKSDGTGAGTVLVKDIYAGADSSKPENFILLGSTVIFTATDATHGEEVWKTDGTSGGTTLLKDINPGTGSSTKRSIEIAPGFNYDISIFNGFHVFNNKAYFNAYDGNSAGEMWGTDGTAVGTTLIKDIIPGVPAGFSPNFILLTNAVNLPGKFFFGVSDGSTRSELWQSDGTANGTTLFRSFDNTNEGFPYILTNYTFDPGTGTISYQLFQGNKFFFSAATNAAGREVWISDGTLANTKLIKDINPGSANSTDRLTYSFTSTEMYFSADDGVKGNELWKTDGTTAGTLLVADINTGSGSSDPELDFFGTTNNIIFVANNGDNTATDLYIIGGTISASNPCPGGTISFTSNITGASYQWQVNTGAGFANISNNSTYAGATTVTLQLNNAPSSFYGYQYRCNVAGTFSTVSNIKFVNRWTGAANTLWNNPANWSCGTVPDANTDVVISTGTAVLNVNGSCRSIAVSAGAKFTASAGFTLVVTH